MLDAVDEHALDIRHILDEACHDVAGGAVVEPGEGKPLDVRVEFAAEVENDALLEMVVEEDAGGVQAVLRDECGQAESEEGGEEFRPVLPDHIIHDPLCDRREDDNHERARDGAGERGEGEERIAPHIGEDPDENLHGA